MAKLDVLVWPAKVLETKSDEVASFDGELKQFVKDMHETMDSANGIGLAANQVGVAKRVLTIYIPWVQQDEQDEEKRYWHDQRYTFINPRIVKK